MSFWKKLLGTEKEVEDTPPTPVVEPEEPTRKTPSAADADLELLDECLTNLAAYRLLPRREISLDDLHALPLDGVAQFRRRPLTTLVTCVDEAGTPLFERVFIDAEESSRTTVEHLCELINDAATHAGTVDELRDVTVMLDPSSETSGSLRFTIAREVRDLVFVLDSDFGDPQAEAEILEGVRPAGFDSYTLLAGVGMKQLTIWLPANTDDVLIDELEVENAAGIDEPSIF